MTPESNPKPIKAGSPEQLTALNNHLRRQEQNDAMTNKGQFRRKKLLKVNDLFNDLKPEQIDNILKDEDVE